IYTSTYGRLHHTAHRAHTGTAAACAGSNAWFDRCFSSMVDSTGLID
ncbi:unnamed protein product, partial [Ectocarpus sp. 8 AP-2014]